MPPSTQKYHSSKVSPRVLMDSRKPIRSESDLARSAHPRKRRVMAQNIQSPSLLPSDCRVMALNSPEF